MENEILPPKYHAKVWVTESNFFWTTRKQAIFSSDDASFGLEYELLADGSVILKVINQGDIVGLFQEWDSATIERG